MQTLPILLAEDNEDDIFLMERAFKKAKLTNPLRIVSDGEQALAYLKRARVFTQIGSNFLFQLWCCWTSRCRG